MRSLDIITKKRDGGRLSGEEIGFLVQGYADGIVPDYQMAAFLMAVYFKGMDALETSLLTRAMLSSGKTMSLAGIRGPIIDKHSTGGVGDKVSLVCAPLAAECGLTVPMMSGRGLGHTGGTLDKLEAIPGYVTDLSEERFLKALSDTGFAMIRASELVAPADRLMYSLRDATATVESIPLITASILSKKCAEGADGFVFDVKCGRGAFMKSLTDARSLARSLLAASSELGKKCACVITDMDEPLGYAVGNSVEVEEAAGCLLGKGPDDLTEVSIHLAARMLTLGGIKNTLESAESECRLRIKDGSAFARLLRNVEFQGGDSGYLTGKKSFARPVHESPLIADRDGFINGIDAFIIGHSAVLLGAGRGRKEDSVNPHAGIILRKKTGEPVRSGDELALLLCDDEVRLGEALEHVKSAYSIGKRAPVSRSKIIEEIV